MPRYENKLVVTPTPRTLNLRTTLRDLHPLDYLYRYHSIPPHITLLLLSLTGLTELRLLPLLPSLPDVRSLAVNHCPIDT